MPAAAAVHCNISCGHRESRCSLSSQVGPLERILLNCLCPLACACGTDLRIHICLFCAAVQSATEQLDDMAVDDRPSALTPPVLDNSESGAPQPAQPSPPPPTSGDPALPAAQADGSELTSEQQSVVTALAEMDSRCLVMLTRHMRFSRRHSARHSPGHVQTLHF
jgi:hypothetical protein